MAAVSTKACSGSRNSSSACAVNGVASQASIRTKKTANHAPRRWAENGERFKDKGTNLFRFFRLGYLRLRWTRLGADPIQISGETTNNRKHNQFRQFVRMLLSQAICQFRSPGPCGLESQRDFLITL